MSDPRGKGALDKSGLFLALKLITLAQTGKDVSMANAMADIVEVPEMTGEKPVIRSDILIDPVAPAIMPFQISQEELAMYRKLFLGVVEGGQSHVPGAKVRLKSCHNVVYILIYYGRLFYSYCFGILGESANVGIKTINRHIGQDMGSC